MSNSSSEVDKIVVKIQGLLNLAQDASDDHECQSAFLMAQRLMLKHNLSEADVETDSDRGEKVVDGSPTDEYKTMSWWEKLLVNIITENFRCKCYFTNKKLQGDKRKKSKVVFLGLESDVKIATEMYSLAHASVLFYTERHLREYAQKRRERKTAYIKGFLSGVETKFDEQRFSLIQEFGVMVITPAIVEDEYEKLDLTKGRSFGIPNVDKDAVASFMTGVEEGSTIDFTKSTIDG